MSGIDSKNIEQEEKKLSIKDKIMKDYKEKLFNTMIWIPLKYMKSILLYYFEYISNDIDIKSIKEQYEKDRFIYPSKVPQKDILRLENEIYWLIPNSFDSIELSPVNPLWLNSFLTKINPKIILWTIRMQEVVADSTTVMALETAKRRKELIKQWKKEKIVNLCTSHRFLRTQFFLEELKFLPHFKIFALTTWWRKWNNFSTERTTINTHLKVYFDFFKQINNLWYLAKNITFYISDIRIAETLIKKFNLDRNKIKKNTINLNYSLFDELWLWKNDKVKWDMLDNIKIPEIKKYLYWLKQLEKKLIEELRKKYPEVNFKYDLWRIAWIWYYDSYCFKVHVENKDWLILPLIDAWFADWTRKIMKNQKEFYFSSWIWLELFIQNFKK